MRPLYFTIANSCRVWYKIQAFNTFGLPKAHLRSRIRSFDVLGVYMSS